LAEKADGPDTLATVLHPAETAVPRELPQGSAVVEVHSAGVNPSDRRELQQGWIECQNLPKRCQITKWRANDISSLQKL